MKSEHAFATFRVAGDKLNPDQLTKLIGVEPTMAYSKGQHYKSGPRSPRLRGRTGVWLLDTDHEVKSSRLEDHINWLVGKIEPSKGKLKRFISENDLHAVMTCFWHGASGAEPPAVSKHARGVLEAIPAKLETDFDTDDELPQRSVPLQAR